MTINHQPDPFTPSETKDEQSFRLDSSAHPPKTSATASTAASAWDEAVKTYRRWIGHADSATIRAARQRFLSYCRSLEQRPEFANDAPLVAFGFLTHAAFNEARRKTRIFHR